MTRAELVRRMADAADWPKASADRALRAMLAGVRGALKRGEPVTLVGFGTFSVARRRSRTMRNPRTGHSVTVGGRTPRFKPSRDLNQAVR
jgi:DNA-binding protein HU-beta